MEFILDFYIYDDLLGAIRVTDKRYYILNSQNPVKIYRQVFPGWSHIMNHASGS